MSYAINSTNTGWRAVGSQADLLPGETYSDAQPILTLTPQAQQTALTQAVQDFMDAAAQAKGYDSILSACSYAGAPNPFQAEGQSFLAWRAACWAYCYQVQAAVAAGTQTMPTAAQLIAGLPTRI